MNIHDKNSMHNGHNDSIGCNVKDCKYHCNDENFCTLERINVISHDNTSASMESTDCGSFQSCK